MQTHMNITEIQKIQSSIQGELQHGIEEVQTEQKGMKQKLTEAGK
jgi:hypothetical protein